MKKRGLTLKQRKFVKFYLETGNLSQSSHLAGYKWRCQGVENLSKPAIHEFFQELLDKKGLTDDYLLQKLQEGLEAKKVISANIIIIKNDDPTVKEQIAHSKTQDFIEIEDYLVRHKYLETVLKLKGKYEDSKVAVNNTIVNQITNNANSNGKLDREFQEQMLNRLGRLFQE